MAEEEKASAEAKEAAPAAPKAPSAWPPIIAVLVLMPAISFGVTQFVLIPRIKAAVMQPGRENRKTLPRRAQGKSSR